METTIEKPKLKKLSLGGIAKKEETKTVYPVLVDEEASALAALIVDNREQLKALEGSLEVAEAELKMKATPFYFANSNGKQDVPSSISVPSICGEVLVVFQNRYSQLKDESPVVAVLGERTEKFFRQSLEIKIKSEKLPEAHAQAMLGELEALFAKYNALDALEAKEVIKPTPEFHAARHLQLSVDENLALEAACPIVAQIKTKGRK